MRIKYAEFSSFLTISLAGSNPPKTFPNCFERYESLNLGNDPSEKNKLPSLTKFKNSLCA